MMVMLVLFVFMMMVLMLVFVVIIIVIFIVMTFQFLNPGCRCCHFLVVEEVGVQQFVEFHITVVAIDNLCFFLDAAHDLAYPFQLVRLDVGSFVQQYDVAKLDLLDDEVIDVLFVDVFLGEV